jgi:hypothetical protein
MQDDMKARVQEIDALNKEQSKKIYYGLAHNRIGCLRICIEACAKCYVTKACASFGENEYGCGYVCQECLVALFSNFKQKFKDEFTSAPVPGVIDAAENYRRACCMIDEAMPTNVDPRFAANFKQAVAKEASSQYFPNPGLPTSDELRKTMEAALNAPFEQKPESIPIDKMNVTQLKAFITAKRGSHAGCVEKSELVRLAKSLT